jgi:activating signal cointegrator complex subunit 3
MPVLNVDISVCGWWENESTKQERRFKRPPTKTDWIQVHADQEYTLMVQLERVNRTRDLKVQSSRFPRGKDEGWFLTLGSIESGELMALKRVSAVRGSRKCQQLTFFTPKTIGKNHVRNKYYISSPLHFSF